MMNKESLIFLAASLAVTVAVSAVGFSLAALPRPAVEAAKKPAAAENLPDIDIGGGFGKVSVIELVGFYIENPPAPKGAGGDAAPAVKRFGGC
ncbi:MAG: hypothetical protein KF853_08190 [Rhodocyclaceae bacterium]|jgi:hypothetical protein|nr:hypothetical protein [Rhodocyclaceae bacterium]MBZ0132728.1 hypothetical protein [Rhodocyclaceae bacterium]